MKKEFEELGGMDMYQEASLEGEKLKKFQTSTWFLKQITQKNCTLKLMSNFDFKNANKRLKLLDVGALSFNYDKQSKWIDCTAIGKAQIEGKKQKKFKTKNSKPTLLECFLCPQTFTQYLKW